jgi:hypothetical protein
MMMGPFAPVYNVNLPILFPLLLPCANIFLQYLIAHPIALGALTQLRAATDLEGANWNGKVSLLVPYSPRF